MRAAGTRELQGPRKADRSASESGALLSNQGWRKLVISEVASSVILANDRTALNLFPRL